MNWAAAAAAISALGFFASILVAAYVYGKLTQQTADNAKRLGEHDERFDRHDDLLNDHRNRLGINEKDIEGVKQWNRGFEACRREERG